MKRSDSTEMDRLLRRYSRLKGEALRAERGASDEAKAEAVSGAHLDADEMNAYAEGALPEAARSRYFAHLADCDSCRKIVTDLTLAASLEDEGKARVASSGTAPSKSWRGWLAAIFSPPALRYAVPALALFAVIIVAIVAMRTQRKESSIAQNNEASKYSAPATATDSSSATQNTAANGTAGSHSNSNVAPLVEQQNQAQPGILTYATPTPANPAPLADGAPAVSPDTVAKSMPAQTGDTKDSSGEFGVAAGKRAQREVAEAAPPPAPQPTVLSDTTATEADNRDKRAEPKKAKVAEKDDTDEVTVNKKSAGGLAAKQEVAREDRPDLGRAATTARAAQNEPRNRRAAPAAKSGPPTDGADEERQVETRNVGGRHFRKQGSAWVDTAYSPSRQTTNVARGSEQYRALVADEPGLRAIAERLGGEVFVVWKSRAYRFY
jgi:hypothetical protein